MIEISELEQALRDLINEPRRHAELRRDERQFSQLCSALDVVGDTEAALEAFLASDAKRRSIGDLYLRAYGVFQVLFVQQDAIEHIAESLSLEFERPAEFQEIRNIRNDSVGHPSRRGNSGRAFNHIVRRTLSHGGFDLVTFETGLPAKRKKINLLSLVEQQRKLVAAALRKFVQSEVDREEQHRKAFRSKPLVAAFPSTLGYTMDKLRDEVAGSEPLGLGIDFLVEVGSAISELEQGLSTRGELPELEDVFGYHAGPARHVIERLRQYFTREEPALMSREDAETFLFRLCAEVGNLRKLAQEIDQTYSSTPLNETEGSFEGAC